MEWSDSCYHKRIEWLVFLSLTICLFVCQQIIVLHPFASISNLCVCYKYECICENVSHMENVKPCIIIYKVLGLSTHCQLVLDCMLILLHGIMKLQIIKSYLLCRWSWCMNIKEFFLKWYIKCARYEICFTFCLVAVLWHILSAEYCLVKYKVRNFVLFYIFGSRLIFLGA